MNLSKNAAPNIYANLSTCKTQSCIRKDSGLHLVLCCQVSSLHTYFIPYFEFIHPTYRARLFSLSLLSSPYRLQCLYLYLSVL